MLGFANYSRFFQRIDRRYADFLVLLAPGEPQRAAMQNTYDALLGKGLAVSAALRISRQLVMHRLIQLDCEQHAILSVVTRAVTDLAELALEIALKTAHEELDARHGSPLNSAHMWIVGMGKLGARELNVSSDIDLIYVYDQDGETAGNTEGRNKISNHEYFAKAVKIVYDLVGATTEHGFVFRVDLALRPHGNSGPAAVSLAGLEQYLQVQGREWERFAWLKSRVVAPQSSISNDSAKALRDVVLPFVFRKYLDYSVFESLRTLHLQIRQESARRSAGRPERANDVKLSRGGIREIEFTVQLLQVVRGGQYPELRKRPTLDALQRVAHAGLMPQATADALCQAYAFLRRVEHRIQYLDDQQTHAMPTQDADLQWIAQSMGYKDCDSDSCAFLSDLDAHRELVANEFDKLLGGFQQTKPKDCGTQECKVCPVPATSTATSPAASITTATPATEFAKRIAALSEHPRVLNLREDARNRLMRLVQRTSAWLQEGRVTELAALRSADFLEPLLRRESYLALLWERPVVHERLLKLLGSARWPASYLLKHPGVMDELAGDAWLTERFEPPEFEAELALRLKALKSTGQDDVETLLNLLRRAHHAELFRILARDVEGQLTVEQVADDLSALADTVLRITVAWCWERHKNKHIGYPQIAIIGYGKLGGKELGYGSDLDIVFIYEDADENAGVIYSSFVRKLITWLDTKTSEGDLFEIDTALRPNGNSGLLVTSFAAFADYQEKRGSNTAWTWEHQAMTRARFVAGFEPLRAKFDQVRQNVISAPRDLPALQQEIIAMRDKVRAAHPVKPAMFDAKFDVKHSPGGMVDAEFAVQYLVLAHSAAHPELQPNLGNIALMQRAEAAGLLPAGVGEAAATAYRSLRHVQHVARLDEAPTQVAASELRLERDAMLALWNAVFATN